LITIDSLNRVFFTVFDEKKKKGEDENAPKKHDQIIQEINRTQNLGLSNAEIASFRQLYAVGLPFSSLKQLLAMTPAEQAKVNQPGIPVLDSANNQLYSWIRATKYAYTGAKDFQYLIKGDKGSLYPTFEAVVSALKRNDVFKYNLITSLGQAPSGSDYDMMRKTFKPAKETPATEK